MKNDLDNKFEKGILLFYGYGYRSIPDQVKNNYSSRMKFFFKSSEQLNRLNDQVQVSRYSGYQDTGWETSDVVFFDQDAVKGLLIGYPANAHYVLVNMANVRYLHWIMIGLFRRILIRQVRFLGFKKLTHNGHRSIWLVLSRKQLVSNNNFYLSREVGIEGFLKYMQINNINYVVPRFFESLPSLHREGGDLDLLVSDQDESAVKQFLLENEGDIRVDVWSVSRPSYHGITYMPPRLAQEVLDNSMEGNAMAKIPSPLHSLNCLLFHVLYHKGFQSGVPSKYDSGAVSQPNNDYLCLIKKYTTQLDLTVEYTMEGLDEYMSKIKWRPALDTLAKIAQWNEWVRVHHFDEKTEEKSSLFALVLKSEAVERGFSQDVISECELADYDLIYNRVLRGEVQREAINNIRGGVWNDGLTYQDNISKYYPAQILILWDKSGRGEQGLSQLKSHIRKKIDDSKTSYIHSTDNDTQTWDYIKICLPDKEIELRNKLAILNKTKRKNWGRFNRQSISYGITNIRTKTKAALVKVISH